MKQRLRQEPSLSGAHQYLSPTSVKLGGDAALLHVLRMLNHSDPRIANKALFRLADLSNRSAAPEVNKQVVEGLVHAALFDHRWHVYYLSARLLSLLDDSRYAQHLLVLALRTRQPDLRARVLRVLEKVAGDNAQEIYLRSLSDSAPSVRSAATIALGKLGLESGITALLGALTDPEPDVQFHVVEALGRIRSHHVYEPLVTMYQTSDVESVQRAALVAISQLGHQDAEALLVTALGSTDWRNRKHGIEGLGRLKHLSLDAVRALTLALTDPVSYIRENAAKLLARVDTALFTNELVATLQTYLAYNPSEHVRTLTARVLGYQLTDLAVPFLIMCLHQEENFNVQRTLVRVLERIGTPEADKAAYAWRTGELAS